MQTASREDVSGSACLTGEAALEEDDAGDGSRRSSRCITWQAVADMQACTH